MIEAELCFFEMEVEGMFGDAVELKQAAFREAPEAFDAVDVLRSAGELVVGVADPEVLVEAEIDQAVVTSPAVGMEHGFGSDSAADHRLQSGFGDVGNDLGVDLVASFEQTEDDRLAAGSSASSAAHATRAKVRLVGLDFALEWRVALTGFGHPPSHSQKNRVHGSDRDAGDGGGLGRRQIQHKTANQMPESRFTDLGMSKILVNPIHLRRLALSSKSSAS